MQILVRALCWPWDALRAFWKLPRLILRLDAALSRFEPQPDDPRYKSNFYRERKL